MQGIQNPNPRPQTQNKDYRSRADVGVEGTWMVYLSRCAELH